ncbi:MAG: zf-HC2 domain-containing protein [Phycisphaerae bacterium]|nr:zf-HC2 domain-containing protein [Phycisphaerae bacterium]
MKDPCDNFAELLVDYADGQLSAEQSTKVADHLAECSDCRVTLDGLHRSLEIAQVIWQDNLSQTETIRIAASPRPRRRSWPRYAAAAVILIVSAVSITSRLMNNPPKSEATFAEIEQKITEAGAAARLLAATDLLAEQADAESIVKRQYRYVVQTYPETLAAAEAELRIR